MAEIKTTIGFLEKSTNRAIDSTAIWLFKQRHPGRKIPPKKAKQIIRRYRKRIFKKPIDSLFKALDEKIFEEYGVRVNG